MMRRTMRIEHEGVTYAGTQVVIKQTHLGPEDHGIFTAYLHVEWSGSGTGIGGLAFGVANPDRGTWIKSSFGINWVAGVLYAVGASAWENLVGLSVIMLHPEGRDSGAGMDCVGLAHTSEDRIFLFDSIKEKN